MAKEKKQTPMMEQYWQVRNSLSKDIILMFRLGDFYELFYDDAIEGSKILGINLTKRSDYPMAGIPHHVADQYIPKFLQAGRKVAICEQDEAPKPGKIVKRSINRILTPGTTIEESQLDGKRSNFALSIFIDSKKKLYASWLDVSSSDFYCAVFDNPHDFLPLLSACDPREIILPEDASRDWKNSPELCSWNAIFRSLVDFRPVTLLQDYRFDALWGESQLIEHFGVNSLEGFGIESGSSLAGVAGALLFYVADNLRNKPNNIRAIRRVITNDFVLVDPSTQRSLEIFKDSLGGKNGSLFSVLDKTKTSAGARLLESFLTCPTRNISEIQRRQNFVWELFSSPAQCERLGELLAEVRDIPRILSRLQNRVRNPRELGALLSSLEQFEPIVNVLRSIHSGVCEKAAENMPDFSELRNYLSSALADEIPAKIQDGGVIRAGFDAEIDRLRNLSRDNMAWLADLEASEQAATGIKNLRIKYNGAFGYFIEITKSNLSLVPAHYIRRQTVSNSERYTTEELRQKEREILHAEEFAREMEEKVFLEIIESVLKQSANLTKASEILAELDVFRGWAELSNAWDYCRPSVNSGDAISITGGRHPVVEQTLLLSPSVSAKNRSFVPNDVCVSSSGEQILLITGPNMAGKSTYIRQTALIVLMAQIGCFVPASSCEIGVVDRIFSRVGANDELSKGNSTFMVEMNETSNILNNATDNSLIILDEVGRGTSTYDGLSLAWAIVEFIHGGGKKGPKTLFATHYHEMTKLEQVLPRLSNYKVCVKEWNDEIIFVRRIEKGAADKSYGIQVARLAGLPEKVLSRAKEVLCELESEGDMIAVKLDVSPKKRTKKSPDDDKSNFKQLSFF